VGQTWPGERFHPPVEHSAVFALSRALRAGAGSAVTWHSGRRAPAPYRGQVGTEGGISCSRKGMLGGLQQSRHAVVWVEHRSTPQQDAGDPEQLIGNPAQGAAVGMPLGPPGIVAASALGGIPDDHASPVEHSLAQPDLGGVAGDDDARLVAAYGGRRKPGKGSERRVVPARKRSIRFVEQDGKRAQANTGQRREDGGITWFATLCRIDLSQGGAEFARLALGLGELAVCQV